MTKDEIRQMIIEVADNIYNNPKNLSNPLSDLNSAVENISATILNNVETLMIEILYEMQKQK